MTASDRETSSNRGGIPSAEPVQLAELVDYAPGAVVSRTLEKTKGGTLTVFAFDAGEELSEHTAPFNAYVSILDGSVELTIGGEVVIATKGETVLMPADVPHAVHAVERFKMLLMMIRDPGEKN
jgi:quercetin dioxygenase-like cupin family protein